jgi:RHS repeat-associated protein
LGEAQKRSYLKRLGSSGAWTNSYVYLGGELLAQYSGGSGGTTYFALTDNLSSTRLLTAMDQSVYDSMDFLPFGEQIGGASGSTHKFTGYERDGESGKDYAFARYFGSNMGRFMSADPLVGDMGDPQSLNLYTYVRNNAVNLIDPSGLCFESLGSERCGGFKFVFTWSWGADHEDDGNPPLHPYPTRPPMRTSPAPHVAYGILPGETAGVPDWLDMPSFGLQGLSLPSGFMQAQVCAANPAVCWQSLNWLVRLLWPIALAKGRTKDRVDGVPRIDQLQRNCSPIGGPVVEE